VIADDYGNPLTTTSSAAPDAYIAGYRLLFMTAPEADTEFARATEADPGFALPYLGTAQVAAMRGDVSAVQAAFAAAKSPFENVARARMRAAVPPHRRDVDERAPQASGRV
jgi:hypothetical protein